MSTGYSMLVPRLKQSKMYAAMVFLESRYLGKQYESIPHYKQVEVELWEKVGLCIHQVYGKCRFPNEWIISHYLSGRSVVRGIPTRSKALCLMMEIRNKIMLDWNMTYEGFMGHSNKDKIVETIKKIQARLDKEGQWDEKDQSKFQRRKRTRNSKNLNRALMPNHRT